MNAKEWLNRAKNLDREIKVLEDQKEVLYAQITKVTMSIDTERVSGSKTKSDKIETYIDLLHTIDNRIKELNNIKTEIINAISEIPDSACRTLLFERYINNKKFYAVANVINYSEKYTIQHLHPKALKYINNIIQNKR